MSILNNKDMSLRRRIKSFLCSKSYKPLVLRIGDMFPGHPFILFVILFTCSFFIRKIPGLNLTNSLGISFVIPYLIFFVRRLRQYIDNIKPSLVVEESEYLTLKNKIGRYTFLRFLAISLLAPLLVFIVNYSSGPGHFTIEGQRSIMGIGIGFYSAVFTGMLLLQMNYIAITEVFRFNVIAKKYAEVDLLDIDKLDGFSQVALLAGMSIIGVYTVIPISLIEEPELKQSLLSSIVISLPILLVILAIPLYRIYSEIKTKLEEEKTLIQQSLAGDDVSMNKLTISSKQKSLSTMQLIQYRSYINDLSPFPVAQKSIIKSLWSLGLLIISWVVPLLFTS